MKQKTSKTEHSKAYFILLVMRSIWGLSFRMREKARQEIQHIKAMEYLAKNPKPTGICNGCGGSVYDGESECSNNCRDAVEVQMWGYCA